MFLLTTAIRVRPALRLRGMLAGSALVLGMAGAVQAQVQSRVPPPSAAAAVVRVALPQTTGFQQALIAAASEDAAVAAFYRDRGYGAFWTGAADAPRRAALLSALEKAALHALPAGRHDAARLVSAFHAAASEGDRARLEVQLSQALLAFARDLETGILTPARVDPGIVREVPRRDPREILDRFAADPEGFLRALPPQHPEYARLVKARARLVAQMAQGGWGPRVSAKVLKPGASGPAVIELRDRLMRMGYLGRSSAATYDAALQAAVQEFQFDHGLAVDGVATEATLAEINTPPSARLKAVTVAMERERWTNIERGRRHIWVNLVDFTAKIVDDGKVTFSTRAVVGSTIADKRTPEFSHRMTYMEVNPDWTVPRGIIRRDYLPKLQANPGALGHLQVVDSRGRVVPRGSVNFSAYSAGNFPYSLRQAPGASNALGRVKFMFPNPHAIYLHDTPDKHLFARENRTYSSGCVRLNDPFDFAYALLARQEDDPKAAFHRVLDSGRQERIYLKDPVPIHLEYRTAFTSAKGRVQYRRDVYGRDAAIWTALERAGVAVPGEAG